MSNEKENPEMEEADDCGDLDSYEEIEVCEAPAVYYQEEDL